MWQWLVWIKVAGEWMYCGGFDMRNDSVTPVTVAAKIAGLDYHTELVWFDR